MGQLNTTQSYPRSHRNTNRYIGLLRLQQLYQTFQQVRESRYVTCTSSSKLYFNMCESLPGSPLLTRKVTLSPASSNRDVRGDHGHLVIPQISVRGTATQRWTRLLQNARRSGAAGQSGVRLATPSDPHYQTLDPAKQDPVSYIQLIQSGPYVQSYTWLKRKLTHCDSSWMLRFLELDGLGILYAALRKLTERGHLSIAHAYAQVECVACFKAVMNSQAGLDYIIDDTEFIRKLATGKDLF